MNHLRSAELLLIVTAAAIAGTGAGITRIPSFPFEVAWQESELVAHATRVVRLLRDRRFEDATTSWDQTMTKTLPARMLEDIWTTLGRQVGSLNRVGAGTVVPWGGLRAVSIPLTFARGALVGTVVFDRDGKVAGIHFGPKN